MPDRNQLDAGGHDLPAIGITGGSSSVSPRVETRTCPRCKGDGRIVHIGESLNRRSGLYGRDPQFDDDMACTLCDEEGVIPVRRAA